MSPGEKVNRGRGIFIHPACDGIGFSFTPSTTYGDVLDTVFAWCESNALRNTKYDYGGLAKEFDISIEYVRQIEKLVYEIN